MSLPRRLPLALCLAGVVFAAPADEARRLLAGGEAERARELLESWVLDHADDADAWLDLGRARSALQDWEASEDAYLRALELRPADAVAMNNLGNVYFRQNRFEEASSWYGRALAVRPDYVNALYHDGWVMRQLNRLAEAEGRLKACIDVQTTDGRDRRVQVDCLFFLGAVYSRMGEHEKTRQAMERVLSIFPQHPEARYYLATAYRHLGRADDARRQLELHRQLLESARSDTPIAREPAP